MQLRTVWPILTETFRQWSEDKPFQLAAALAYYTLFSLAPLLLIAVTIAGLAFGREATEQQIMTTLADSLARKALKGFKVCCRVLAARSRACSGRC